MGSEPPRHPISRADYLGALEIVARMAERLSVDRRDMAGGIVERLRRADRVVPALNQLRVGTNVEIQLVLGSVIKAATFALNPASWRAAVAARAANSKAAADLVAQLLELDHDSSIAISFFQRRALADLKQSLEEDAASFAALPRKEGVSQKPSPAILMLRSLRKLLFGGPSRLSPRRRMALRWLAEAALGADEISDGTLTAALRTPRTSGDSGRGKAKK